MKGYQLRAIILRLPMRPVEHRDSPLGGPALLQISSATIHVNHSILDISSQRTPTPKR